MVDRERKKKGHLNFHFVRGAEVLRTELQLRAEGLPKFSRCRMDPPVLTGLDRRSVCVCLQWWEQC